MFPLFSRTHRHWQTLIKAIDPRAPDLGKLQQLRDALVDQHTTVPTGLLWKMLDRTEAATSQIEESAAASLIDEIRRSALWELGTRNRAT